MKSFNNYLFFILILLILSPNGVFAGGIKTEKVLTSNVDTSRKITIPKILKKDYRINSLGGDYSARQYNPSFAVDSSGNMAVAWIDERTGGRNIYIQFYNKDGQPRGTNIKVNENFSHDISLPSVAMNNKNECVVVWMESGVNIKVQRYFTSGERLGDNNTILSQNVTTFSPNSAALNNDGYLTVLIGSNNTGTNYVTYYTYVFKKDSYSMYYLVNSYLSSGGIVSSWENNGFVKTLQNGSFYAIWQAENGERLTNLFFIDPKNSYNSEFINFSDSLGGELSNPRIVKLASDEYLCAWNSYDNNIYKSEIHGRRFNSTGKAISPTFKLCEGSLACLAEGLNGVVSVIYYNNGRVFGRKLKIDNSSVSTTFNIPLPSTGYTRVENTNINYVSDSTCFFTFTAFKYGESDIFLQKIKGSEVTTIAKVNDDKYCSTQNQPAVCAGLNGQNLVYWIDKRNGADDIYCRLFNKEGEPLFDDIKVTSEIETKNVIKSACVLPNGDFVIGYICSTQYDLRVLSLVLISSTGKVLKKASINNVDGGFYYTELKLNCDENDEILVLANTRQNYCHRASSVKFNKNLEQLNNFFNLFELTSDYPNYSFSASLSRENKIFLTYTIPNEVTGSNYVFIKGVIYNSDGKIEKDTFNIYQYMRYLNVNIADNYLLPGGREFALLFSTNNAFNVIRHYADKEYIAQLSNGDLFDDINAPRILSFENNKLLMSYMINYDIYSMFFNDNKMLVNNYLHHSFEPVNYPVPEYHLSFGCAINDGRLIFAYEDNKQLDGGYDIWANIQDMSEAGFNKEYCFTKVDRDALHNNYPNPFNATTKIPFTLLAYHKVKLAVYDVLGREVKVLIDKDLEKGVYEAELNGSGLPAGVYFCRLEAFDTSVKKIILLK